MLCALSKTWSRSLLLPIDTIQYGLVDPLFHLSPLSNPNGLPRKNTKKMEPKSSTENACEYSMTLIDLISHDAEWPTKNSQKRKDHLLSELLNFDRNQIKFHRKKQIYSFYFDLNLF